MSASTLAGPQRSRSAEVNEDDLRDRISEVLDRWPTAGLTVAVVRDGHLEWFHGRGVANVEARTPVTEDTVFRIGSITKTFTGIAVMQLWEQGLIELDAPADEYLRAFRLIPASSSFRPTIRHLLTHTGGVGFVRGITDVLRPGFGWGVPRGHRVLPLADYYRKGLRVEVEPGTKWVYSNHGFATLGQVVEDVTDEPFDRYLRDHILEPLGMESSELLRNERLEPRLAKGYVLRSGGLKEVDVDVATPGGGSMYSTARDMALYTAALLDGGENDHGSVLKPETLATMFQPHYRPHPRVPGMGLAFFLGEEDGHRTIGHGGTVPGFLSDMTLAPDEGLGVVVLGNTGGISGIGAPGPVATAVLRNLLGLPDASLPTGVPDRPEVWRDLCGWYGLEPGPVTNLFMRVLVGAGWEVVVQRGHLMLRPLLPIPAMRKGLRLFADDPDDPYVFRIDMSDLAKGTMRVVFDSEPGPAPRRLVMYADVLRKRPDNRHPSRWAKGVLAVVGTAMLVRRVRRALRARRAATTDREVA